MKQTLKIFHTSFTRHLICLATVLLLAGCGAGSGQGLDENGNLLGTGGTGGGGGGTGNATLSWVQSNVFTPVCSFCHGGPSPAFTLNWDSQQKTCANVGRDSLQISTMKEIESGNPDASYLIWKLEGQGPNGESIEIDQMPKGGTPLDQATIDNIRDWISAGTPGCSTPRSDGSTATRLSEPESGSTYAEGSWMHMWNESLRVCTLCHSLTPSSPRCSVDLECPPNGVVLTADNYFGVVDGNTVAPFDLERSVLWQRVTENDPEKRMPLGYEALTQTQLDTIQNWIEDGAPFCPENMVCP